MVPLIVPARVKEQQLEVKRDEPQPRVSLLVTVGVCIHAAAKAPPNAKAKSDGPAAVLQTTSRDAVVLELD